MSYLLKVHSVAIILLRKGVHKNMFINDRLYEHCTESEFTELPSAFFMVDVVYILVYVLRFQQLKITL